MAIPTLLAPIISSVSKFLSLPALAVFFASILGQIISFFAKWFTTRVAIQLGVITAIVSLTVAVFLTIKSLMQAIKIVLPPGFNQAVSFFVPDNLPLCFSVLASAHAVRWLWAWKMHFIELYAKSAR